MPDISYKLQFTTTGSTQKGNHNNANLEYHCKDHLICVIMIFPDSTNFIIHFFFVCFVSTFKEAGYQFAPGDEG